MQFLQEINLRQVKRAFVVAQKIRLTKKTRYLLKLQHAAFVKKLTATKKIVHQFTDKKLDKIVGEYKKRIIAYNNTKWYAAIASPHELGVWRGAGTLPFSWTHNSLYQTARLVETGLKNEDKRIRARAKRAISQIIEHAALISKEKYLFPIVFRGGTGTKGRRGCTKTKGDIDDGNMRAIALTIAGYKRLHVYFGKLKDV